VAALPLHRLLSHRRSHRQQQQQQSDHHHQLETLEVDQAAALISSAALAQWRCAALLL
jgi:hypothetical protein